MRILSLNRHSNQYERVIDETSGLTARRSLKDADKGFVIFVICIGNGDFIEDFRMNDQKS